MKTYLSQREFCDLAHGHREKLRAVFGIPKSGQIKVRSSVQGDILDSDGTETKDLMETVTIPALAKFLGVPDGDFDVLFAETLKKLFPNDFKDLQIPKPQPTEPVPEVVTEKSTKPKTIKVTQKKKTSK